MRSFLPSFDLRRPESLDAALATLAGEVGAWRPFAGGTDLMVLMEAGALRHQRFISLWGIPELRGVTVTDDTVSIGAMTTYTDLMRHPVVQAEFPLLVDAASQTGGVATQNRGTVGGNIANGSPAADTPPALLVYDAELELISVRGSRRVAYRSIPHRLQDEPACRRRAHRFHPPAPEPAENGGQRIARSVHAGRRRSPRSALPRPRSSTAIGWRTSGSPSAASLQPLSAPSRPSRRCEGNS